MQMKSIFSKWASCQALFSAALLVAVSWVFASCGGHDDGDAPHDNPDTKPQKDKPELPVSASELQTAAFYILSDSYYGFLEFTDAGYYIMVPYEFLYDTSETKTRGVVMKNGKRHLNRSFSMLRHAKGTRDGEGQNSVFFGRFTQDNPGIFVMNGFGKITVKKFSDGYTLTIQEDGYDAEEVEARLLDKLPSSSELEQVCGVWTLDHVDALFVSYTESSGGEEIFNKSYKPSEIKYFDQDLYHFLMKRYTSQVSALTEDEVLSPTSPMGEISKVIFTDNGTFINVSRSGDAEPFFWDWENTANGVIRWALLPEELDDNDMVSFLNLFTGDKTHNNWNGLEMLEAYTYDLYGEDVDQIFDWFFKVE